MASRVYLLLFCQLLPCRWGGSQPPKATRPPPPPIPRSTFSLSTAPISLIPSPSTISSLLSSTPHGGLFIPN